MRLRKLAAISLVFTLAATMLSGCGKEAGSSGKSEPTDISWFLSTGVVPSKWDTSQYVMKTITKNTGITVSATTPADDADTKLNLQIVNGELSDLITLTNETLIKDMIEADLVWNLEDFFKEYFPDSKIINGNFPEDLKKWLISRDGDWYAFPSHMKTPDNREIWGMNDSTKELWESTDYRSNNGVIFNKDIMDQVGISEDDVKTESGLLAALQRVKDANLSVDGASVIPFLADGNNFQGTGWKSDGGSVGTLTTMFGGLPVDSDGNWSSFYRGDAMKHAVKFLNSCAQKGYIDANQFTFDRAAREAACRSGRVFCFMGNTADTGFYDIENNGFQFYTPGVIESDGGESPVLMKNGTIGRGWLQTFVSKKTKNPEAVAKFLDYMASEEGLKTWNYGEPGVQCEETAEGLITKTDKGFEDGNNAGVTGLGAFWAFANQNFDQKYMDPSTDRGIEPQCAYGLHPKVIKVETAALDELPGGYLENNSEMLAISNEVKSTAGTELANVILQSTDVNFDSNYEAFLKNLDALGLADLESYMNEAVQNNYKEMNVDPVKPVN